MGEQANAQVMGSSLGTELSDLLMCDDIQPGSDPGYQICKTIYTFHPLGQKIAETPVSIAQSQERRIEMAAPKIVLDRFREQWARDGVDKSIHSLGTVARVYGVGSIAMLVKDVESTEPIDPKKLAGLPIAFNILDPLNTSGSIVLNQDPNAMDFMKSERIAVGGKPYHPSRTVTLMNERPIYISWTNSAFGFVGRSVYQRALFPLKTFVQSMLTDDLVTLKAGVLVAKMKPAGSIVNQAMMTLFNLKRSIVQMARTGNVISITPEEAIESLNMLNLEAPYALARKNMLDNIASAVPMPAKFLNNETFAEGFGEGTEDARHIAQYIKGVRDWLKPAYDFFDPIIMRRAWDEPFFETVKETYKDYEGKKYDEVFYEWANSFTPVWPNIIEEPESEKVAVDDVKLKALIAVIQVLAGMVDPQNKALLIQWLVDNFNSTKNLFTTPLNLLMEELEQYLDKQADAAENMQESAAEEDKNDNKPQVKLQRADGAIADFVSSVARLPKHRLDWAKQ